jgi:two-component system, response regulator PdtaR
VPQLSYASRRARAVPRITRVPGSRYPNPCTALHGLAGFPTCGRIYLPSYIADNVDRQGQPRPMVLVVDDEPLLHVITTRVLDRAGFDVLNAQDGVEAIELLSQALRPPSLVVTDIRMPRMNGLELGEWVRTRYPGVPLLYVSGFLYEVPPVPPQDDLTAFLGKPFTPDAFLVEVRRLCARSGGCGGLMVPEDGRELPDARTGRRPAVNETTTREPSSSSAPFQTGTPPAGDAQRM